MTQSETKLSWILGSCLSLLILYTLILTPLWASAQEHKDTTQTLINKRDYNLSLISTATRHKKQFKDYVKNKNLKSSEQEAKAIFDQRMTQWKEASGINRTTYKPKKSIKIKKSKDFMRIEYQSSATGTIEQITSYLGLIESADIPIKIEKLSITSREQASDALSMSLTLSTIYTTTPKNGVSK